MLEFIFGWIIGVWMAQQMSLPSVHQQIQTWWYKPQLSDETTSETTSEIKEEETVPLFTGQMPAPAV